MKTLTFNLFKTMQKTIKGILSLIILSLFAVSGFAQAQKQIKGKVKDSHGEPLVGVTVGVKGSTNATLTDIDGNYTISLPGNVKTITATYVGMKPNQQNVTGNVVNFVLEELSSELNEVVVIGYGTVKRKDLTGSVSSVKGDVVQTVPVSNVAEAITGRLAGVQVTTTEGSPDAEMKIRVRGGGSITGDNTPLYIVDGFPVSSISDIPSSDIESIDVLKDASSTAIYGSRGANGVILLTTKSGKEGKLSVSYNAFFSVKKIAKKLDVLSVPDYLKWQYELALLKNDGESDSYEKYFGLYKDMDLYQDVEGNNWQDLVFGRTGHVFNHNITLSGGNEKTTYAFNYAHIDDKAIMVGSDFSRDNFSLKLKHKPYKNLTFDYSARYSDLTINGGGMNEQNETSSSDSRLRHAVIFTPIPMKSIGSDDYDEEESAGDLYNPFIAIRDNEQVQTRRTLNMTGAITFVVTDGLTLKAELGLDRYDATKNRYYGVSTYYVKNTPSKENQNKPAAFLTNAGRKTIRNTNTLNYDFKKLLNLKDHSLSLLLGQENLKTEQNILTNIIHGFPVDFLAEKAFRLTTQGTPYSIDNYAYPDDKLVSFFGRFNYDYLSKYILSGTFRADGSSKFSRGNRWGYFPSAAFAWRLSSEKFMEPAKGWLDDLKVRLSYGTAGNNNIPTGQIDPTFSSTTTAWIDGFTNYWSASKTMTNPDLKWETTYTRNLGLDFTLFNTRLNGSLEFYLNNTKDLLIEFPVSGTGYDTQYRNMGETQNKGVEFQLSYTAIDTKNIGLNINFNIGFNKNKIKDLGVMNDYYEKSGWASSEITQDYQVAVGGSVGKIYGYKSDGRYEVSDFEGYINNQWVLKEGVADGSGVLGTLRPGMMKLKNLTQGDNTVDSSDKTIIGDANPLHTGGFTLNARVYNFDLSASFNWSYGNDVYNANKIEYTSTSKYQYRNMLDIMSDGNRWTNMRADGTISNDAAELTALNQGTTMWSPFMKQFILSDWAIEDASFLRLNTLTLGYTLPKSFTRGIFAKNLRVYATAYNVFCLTNYSGFDPEVSTRRKTALTPGVDYSAYPKSRQFVFGVNLNF
jgi:TonB-linked SusC/RagA family outer membrane protein